MAVEGHNGGRVGLHAVCIHTCMCRIAAPTSTCADTSGSTHTVPYMSLTYLDDKGSIHVAPPWLQLLS